MRLKFITYVQKTIRIQKKIKAYFKGNFVRIHAFKEVFLNQINILAAQEAKKKTS